MAKSTKIIKPQEGFQEKFVSCNTDFMVGGGVLNPQPLDSLVATPKGFVQIGKIKAGDVVCDTDGKTQRVNFIIDKGILPCVEFTLSDGRKVCSALSHNWFVKKHYGKYTRMTSSEIIDYIDKQEAKRKKSVNRLRIPLCQPVELSLDDNLPIHPYVLGYLIGNGCVSSKAHSPYISTSDEDVVEFIASLGYNLKKAYSENLTSHYEFRGAGFKTLLTESGIYGMVSKNKRIPPKYLNSSVESRFWLLKGLFDSDGCCSTTKGYSSVSYVTTSKGLKDDVIQLIYSLGGTAGVCKKEAYDGMIKGRQYRCLESYYIRPRLKNDKDFFWIRRKKDSAKDNTQGRNAVMLGIKSYQLVGDKHCCCINVDNDKHMYLTDNYVITCNCGKSFAAVLSVAEPSQDPRFRGLFLRNNLADARASGGLLDTFKEVYGSDVDVVESGEPRATFRSGAKIDVTHVADQSREKVLQRFKGRQYDYIYFDEGTGFTWSCFTAIYSRNRGQAAWTGKVRMTTNPERNHWLREFLDWYIGPDGFIREDREGVVRYFFINGETVKDVVWGDTKEDVYRQCKSQIDRVLAKVNGKIGTATYKDIIKSFTFYLGKMSENKASIGNNSGYVGSVALTGGRNAEQLLEGNWNVSPSEELDAPITNSDANQCFLNDPQINNDKWVTCDLADSGTDNFLCLAWNGFHVFDSLILTKTTPRQNAEALEMFAAQHNISNSHVIYDAIRGTYINDYIPEAIPYFSNHVPVGIYGRMAYNLKAECYMRLVEACRQGYLSFSDRIANKIYEHQNLKTPITFQNEFIEECSVVRFKDMPSGKKALISKKEMNAKLGRNRSMDLLDPCAMRFYPCLEFPYGEELMRTTVLEEDEEEMYGRGSIYDETLYG